ncbi:MAG: cupin domain-containing protein [Acidimicrobiales bacterium]
MTNTATTTAPIPGAVASTPYILDRDEGDHRHFLNHLATRKVSADYGSSMSVTEFVAPKSFGPPLHVHDDEDEIMIVLDGEIRCESGAISGVATAGATVFLPHGVPHTFQVISDEARFVTISSSSSSPRSAVFDQMVADLGAPAPGPVQPVPVEIDPGAVAASCARHGIEVLGPPPAPLD